MSCDEEEWEIESVQNWMCSLTYDISSNVSSETPKEWGDERSNLEGAISAAFGFIKLRFGTKNSHCDIGLWSGPSLFGLDVSQRGDR